ncbi:hypothetical protein F8M41_018239 [Gigaspora margarita]|uniref:Tetratricopeptide repeat protein n=1 Tax=Gigaspora margarita TaxID=4874 RepID=A0A8H4ALU8_GIGMA|nr:hypothetical protein F8M41_018239 [Gigaspora margarita]
MGKYNESLADLNKSLTIEPNNLFALKQCDATYYIMNKSSELKLNDKYSVLSDEGTLENLNKLLETELIN